MTVVPVRGAGLRPSEKRPEILGERPIRERVVHHDAVEPSAVVHVFAQRNGAAGLRCRRQEKGIE